MLELAQSLVLNEEALLSLPENKRPVFIYEWLCFLNKVLVAAQKVSVATANDLRCEPLFARRTTFANANRASSSSSCSKCNAVPALRSVR